jgi:hypothetical protein
VTYSQYVYEHKARQRTLEGPWPSWLYWKAASADVCWCGAPAIEGRYSCARCVERVDVRSAHLRRQGARRTPE